MGNTPAQTNRKKQFAPPVTYEFDPKEVPTLSEKFAFVPNNPLTEYISPFKEPTIASLTKCFPKVKPNEPCFYDSVKFSYEEGMELIIRIKPHLSETIHDSATIITKIAIVTTFETDAHHTLIFYGSESRMSFFIPFEPRTLYLFTRLKILCTFGITYYESLSTFKETQKS